ncbi:hypothetical protein BDM02DRAFT_3110645 [Thelephora ganbajun]|uniref:Uncharacterized protein n=1 Tax=Thelephora ganbajun TaxID=370292 RepID=A0ACB6ZPQ4_THEGA|nr:hypothetical protein BDM02DRAFT_3110645 [Thelephora ganbajun]
MRFTAIASISLGLVACVWADTINVKVGDGGGVQPPFEHPESLITVQCNCEAG